MSSEVVEINGTKYELSASLAKRFGYTVDYISRLAREGKVTAKQVGRKWFVEASSLEQFMHVAQLHKEELKKELSAQRKRELVSKREVDMQNILDNVVPHNVKLSLQAGEPRKKTNILQAGVGTSLMLVAGMLLAILGNPQLYIFEQYNSGTIQRGSVFSALFKDNTASVERSFTIDSFFRRELVPVHGMVLLPQTGTTSTTTIINAFSDEVDFHFEDASTGIIRPKFRSGIGEDYLFILVPTESS